MAIKSGETTYHQAKRGIVQNGLVLNLDAGVDASYDGGTTWRDLEGGNNGTLTNGPTFDRDKGGSIVFDGSDDEVICGNDASIQITEGSISAWFAANNGNTSYRGIIAKQNAWGLFVYNDELVTYSWGNGARRGTGIDVGNGAWNNAVMTFTETVGSPSNNAKVYLNGNLVLTTTVKHSNQTATLQIGEANAVQHFSGKISQASVYSRALTATEVLQNYNATRHRFGV